MITHRLKPQGFPIVEGTVIPMSNYFRSHHYRKAKDSIDRLLIGATGSERNQLEIIADWIESAQKEGK